MYVLYNKHRNAYRTYDGWTRIINGAMVGLDDVVRFTKREVKLNEDRLTKGAEFRYFPDYKRALTKKPKDNQGVTNEVH